MKSNLSVRFGKVKSTTNELMSFFPGKISDESTYTFYPVERELLDDN
jgi:hypothetical protein